MLQLFSLTWIKPWLKFLLHENFFICLIFKHWSLVYHCDRLQLEMAIILCLFTQFDQKNFCQLIALHQKLYCLDFLLPGSWLHLRLWYRFQWKLHKKAGVKAARQNFLLLRVTYVSLARHLRVTCASPARHLRVTCASLARHLRVTYMSLCLL